MLWLADFDRNAAGYLHPYGAASCRYATRPVLRTRPGHPALH
jgi:hypothetical protein